MGAIDTYCQHHSAPVVTLIRSHQAGSKLAEREDRDVFQTKMALKGELDAATRKARVVVSLVDSIQTKQAARAALLVFCPSIFWHLQIEAYA
jgi:hypothetical protein